MNLSKNLKAFLAEFPLKALSGHQMFLAVAVHYSAGDTSREISVSDIKRAWPKAFLKKLYNPTFYDRAQQADWVDPVRQGIFLVNDNGIQHLSDVSDTDRLGITPSSKRSLYIFEKKSTHSFDKFLRSIFAKAKLKVLIADSWVDETIFDNVIDSVPKMLGVDLLYGQKRGTFDSRVARFKKEYSKFITRKYSDLHDRFLIVDDVGYILGPSIKDAASNSPALVVSLSKKDSIMLSKFFRSLWTKAK